MNGKSIEWWTKKKYFLGMIMINIHIAIFENSFIPSHPHLLREMKQN